MDLRDPKFDTQEPAEREEFLLGLLRQQVEFSICSCPFWRARFEQSRLEPSQIRTLADWRRLPALEKTEFRDAGVWGLVPNDARESIKIAWSTSGTTGKPTLSAWCEEDWQSLTFSVSRMLAASMPASGIRALNGYNQGHLAGPLYDSAIRCLGGVSLPRSLVDENRWPMVCQLDEFRCNTLILPEGPRNPKADITMRDLLASKSAELRSCQLEWWIGSTATFSEGTIRQAKALGISMITNLYGSSEFGLFAVSCGHDAKCFHIAEGHVLVEVIDRSGRTVSDGERGRIVVSKLSGVTRQGQLCPHRGTQLLRLDVGNEATVHRKPCRCGLTTARITNIQRAS